MIFIRSALLILAIISAVSGCRNQAETEKRIPAAEVKKTLREVNKALVDKDKEQIEAYIERHNLDGMRSNGAGLYYLVWGDSTGKKVEEGSIVILNYKVKLLDGTLCYSSDGQDAKEFVVGQGGVEAGLDMGVRLLRKGQRGKFILPPHLAHGLIGDSNKIPPRAIIVYDVHLLNVIDK
ncbi:MAG TPA: FKBP-type peptidyl-prolyl cis-trans isomerase [Tenuifilaceae bacterium]|nr:FKBP-type peptidyl-prolyl cis-trans isomerase [Tenuifilaceae bacterium]HPE17969.1 FKBP-type peptidyl-prolyl cis-trans isomerase [Tenuifilaceae bacterium]HPJ44909.1 FKBP-type peptidyl-prolyl cis-trans isomerase [Tenuifilaceae bacterium]HPQ33125.1 FKBP-type peptidyl-prolyl cis-trans isomerase [Tenuifilaceae bacterium]HRX67057.1 FKBP-type peptidyl-prolyl cis-trans isomerase [Tenuifilaceae bacterium]